MFLQTITVFAFVQGKLRSLQSKVTLYLEMLQRATVCVAVRKLFRNRDFACCVWVLTVCCVVVLLGGVRLSMFVLLLIL